MQIDQKKKIVTQRPRTETKQKKIVQPNKKIKLKQKKEIEIERRIIIYQDWIDVYHFFFLLRISVAIFFLRPKVDVILVFPVGFVTQEKVSLFFFFYCIKGSSEEVGQRLKFLKKTLKKFSFLGLEINFCFSKKYAKASSGQSWQQIVCFFLLFGFYCGMDRTCSTNSPSRHPASSLALFSFFHFIRRF